MRCIDENNPIALETDTSKSLKMFEERSTPRIDPSAAKESVADGMHPEYW
jgi:hypothetical protein